MITEQDYQKAVAEPSFRLEFLDNVFQTFLHPAERVYTSGFFYHEGCRRESTECAGIGIVMDVPSLKQILPPMQQFEPPPRGPPRPVPAIGSEIYVSPQAFDLYTHPTLNDFLSSLLDHAVFHARETFFDPLLATLEPLSLLTRLQMYLSDHFFHGNFSRSITQKRYWERELRADRNQLEYQGKRRLSSHFVKRLLDRTNTLELFYGP